MIIDDFQERWQRSLEKSKYFQTQKKYIAFGVGQVVEAVEEK